jgi:hypothetical protein
VVLLAIISFPPLAHSTIAWFRCCSTAADVSSHSLRPRLDPSRIVQRLRPGQVSLVMPLPLKDHAEKRDCVVICNSFPGGLGRRRRRKSMRRGRRV